MAKGKGGDNEAAQARADEQQRQERIRAGTTRINDIFGGAGTKRGINPVDMSSLVTDGSKTYYDATGNPIDFSVGQRKVEASPQYYGDVETTGGGKGFDDAFFDSRKQAYIDFATPQLEDQYDKAKRELTFSLARSGTLDSSVRSNKLSELQKLYDLNKQQVADQGLTYSTTARNAVEDARGNLISTLNATGDAEGAASSAISRASALSQPAQFSPLSNLFADFTAALGTQAAQERAAALSGGTYQPKFNTGLFAPSTTAVKTY